MLKPSDQSVSSDTPYQHTTALSFPVPPFRRMKTVFEENVIFHADSANQIPMKRVQQSPAYNIHQEDEHTSSRTSIFIGLNPHRKPLGNATPNTPHPDDVRDIDSAVYRSFDIRPVLKKEIR